MSAKIEVLYKLLYRKRSKTEYHICIKPDFKCQEEALFKFFCMKERLGPHVKRSIQGIKLDPHINFWQNLRKNKIWPIEEPFLSNDVTMTS